MGIRVGARALVGASGESYENSDCSQKNVGWNLGDRLGMSLYRGRDDSLLWSLS